MRVVNRTGDRLELRGVPQGRSLVFGMVVCVAIAVVAGIFVWMALQRNKSVLAAVMPALGVLFMLGMLSVLVLASFRRERLVLDRVTKLAEHETWSLLFGSRKRHDYSFDRIAAVSIERTMQSPGGGRGFPTPVTRTRLLIDRPRRAIEMDEVQRGSDTPVEALAKEVADFLGCELRRIGSHDEPAKKRAKRD